MKIKRICAIGLAGWLISATLHAHDGAHEEVPHATTAAAGSPRVEAHSDLFEIIGVADHSTLTLYLDRYADNEPVKDAKIEVEAGTEKGIATPNPDGSYTFASKLLTKPGTLPFTFTVIAGKDSDLLTGELVRPDPNASQAHAAAIEPTRSTWIIGGVGALLFALAAALALRARRLRRKAF